MNEKNETLFLFLEIRVLEGKACNFILTIQNTWVGPWQHWKMWVLQLYIYIYTYTHAHTYIYTHTRMCTWVYIYIYTHTRTNVLNRITQLKRAYRDPSPTAIPGLTYKNSKLCLVQLSGILCRFSWTAHINSAEVTSSHVRRIKYINFCSLNISEDRRKFQWS